MPNEIVSQRREVTDGVCSVCGANDELSEVDNVVLCPGCESDADRESAQAKHGDAARAFAIEHCILIGPVEVYDPAHRVAPSQDAYAAGDREAYTANSVRAFNRHSRTNYDELIRNLERFDPRDVVYYDAIRERIEDLIEDAELDEAEDDDDVDDAPEPAK